MAIPEKTRLKARANTLKVAGYREMSLDELRVAVAEAEASVSPNGKAKKAPVKTVAAKPKKAKSATQVAELETATGEDGVEPKKAKATKSNVSSKVKKDKTAPKKASPEKSAPAESKARKTAPRKGKAAQGKAKRPSEPRGAKRDVVRRKYEGGRVGEGGYTNIDLSSIDWTKEMRTAPESKRGQVLALVREHEGDNAAVFEVLRDRASEIYPNAIRAYPTETSKVAASEKMLRWLIARVRYDYVYKTGQHGGRALQRAQEPKINRQATRPQRSRKTAEAKRRTREGTGAAARAATKTRKRGVR